MGEVEAYFGAVKSQGRGTLHLHLLIWLKHVPSPTELQELLKTEAFREKMKVYIAANVRAYLLGLESKTSCNLMPNDMEVGYR